MELRQTMSNMLVTGGTGFIGSHVTRYLVNAGHKVKVLDNNSRGNLDRIPDIIDDIEFIQGDICDINAVERACEGVDTVVHLAFVNGTAHFYNQPKLVMDVAIYGINSIASAIAKYGIRNLVLASSSEVYQSPNVFPTPETIAMTVPELENPRYSYGLGKILQEFYSFHGMPGLDNLKIFRPHNIYGSDMGELHVIPQLFEKAYVSSKSGQALVIEGDGLQTRSFCHISDFIQGFGLILNAPTSKEVFNIGTKEEVSILDLAKRIQKLAGGQEAIEMKALPAGGTLRRVPSINKLESLGFVQSTTLDQGLAEYEEYFTGGLKK
jgi:nucleoside-diphosphate-sugar epimerase